MPDEQVNLMPVKDTVLDGEHCAALFLDRNLEPNIELLRDLSRNLVGEAVPAFFNKLAKDERMEEFLQPLALCAIAKGALGATYPLTEPMMFEKEYSKEQLMAAQQRGNLNALDQKAIDFAVQNFDKMRDVVKDDARSMVFWKVNSKKLTNADIQELIKGWTSFDEAKHGIRACEKLLDHFSDIDKDQTGKINRMEVLKWTLGPGREHRDDFRKFGPGMKGRNVSEEWTKEDLTRRMDTYKAERQKYNDIWNLPKKS